MIYQVLLVGVGGFCGAVSRFGVSRLVHSYFAHPFPTATLVVNVLGCMILGGLFEYFREHQHLPTLTLFVAIGFLGSFTTFSAFSFETIQLFRNHELKLAVLNIGGNLVLCFAAVMFGAWVGAEIS